MKRITHHKTHRPRRRHGLSLIEVVISTLLVGLVLVSALRCVGSLIRGHMSTSELARAQQLAQQLMTEIVNDAYTDEDETPLFGTEPTEPLVTIGPRSGWDDVDDYHLWTATPPEDRDGNPLPNFVGWQRDVMVEWVDPFNPANTSPNDLGVKRITVTVRRNGAMVSELVSLRSEDYTLP